MMDDKFKEELREQLAQARALLTSPEWLIWVNFLKKDRRGILQTKVNKAVEEGNLVKAQIAKALLDDCKMQLDLFGSFIRKTEKQINEEGD